MKMHVVRTCRFLLPPLVGQVATRTRLDERIGGGSFVSFNHPFYNRSVVLQGGTRWLELRFTVARIRAISPAKASYHRQFNKVLSFLRR